MSTVTLPADVRLRIEVFLDRERDERYDVRLASDEMTRGGQEYGEVRLVVFTPGSPTATEYVGPRRKSGEVLGRAVIRETPLDLIPENVRRAALVRLRMATALLPEEDA